MKAPRATYRLQFNEHFRLADALALVPYLSELGISHIYASPLFKARPHSPHGYDVCDFSQLNPELGTEEDLKELVAALRRHGMGLVADIVPNHTGIGTRENCWWWDVLTYGPSSRYAPYFDIDWEVTDPRLRGKVLLPVLSDGYDQVLGRGELRLEMESGTLFLRYFEHWFPIAPRSVPDGLNRCESWQSAANAAVEEINKSPDVLDKLIQQQHYLLSDWRKGDMELNYRRFFAITTLAGIRVEDERVFNETHGLIKRWYDAGWVDGLRVDHPDGLRDPEQYLHRLRGLAPDAWIVVEKILEPDESLPATWPVAGTTGYDFLNCAGGLFIDPKGEKALTDFYAEFTGETTGYPALAREKKRSIVRDQLAAEVKRLTRILVRIAAQDARYASFTVEEVEEAMTEVVVCFPVYRTYARPANGVISEMDAEHIKRALAKAREKQSGLASELFDFLGELLLLRRNGELESDFVLRFQQLTGPVMAKGVEDTAFYCFNRLLVENEVGGDPGHFGTTVEAFHQACRDQQLRWPDTLLATSTHDTKRSEDVRARLSLLSEIPDLWSRAVRRWADLNERHHHAGWPDRNAEYFFYQTLAGAWPLSLKRALECMEKAACEAKQHTSWTRHNEPYETALREFITGTLASHKFRKDLEQFLAPLVEAGHVNSLALTLLKLTAPGVPDIYQGCELWDRSLMDPDNRRSVDFSLRQRLLPEAKTLPLKEIWRHRNEGLPKLWLIQRILELRARQPEVFAASSGYEALFAFGEKAQHVAAFMRGGQVVTVAPRLVLGLDEGWGDTTLELPRGRWKNIITGESIAGGLLNLGDLLHKFPVALLTKMENGR